MDRPFIEHLHIENYGCIRDATFKLTPLHALIGPNDSGKSTVLRALRTLAFLARPSSDEQELDFLQRAFVANKAKGRVVIEASTSTAGLQIAIGPTGFSRFSLIDYVGGGRSEKGPVDFAWDLLTPLLNSVPLYLSPVLAGFELLRLDPDALRAPNSLIPSGERLGFLDERGTGLAAIYDAIMVRDLPAFLKLNEKLSEFFPNVKAISLTNPSSSTKAMGVKLVDGTYVPAELMSEGLLHYLAFAAIQHLDPTAILLVEEPANGLHPARIAEVMRVLREISKTTQVLIATHSPVVINELQGDEVTVVTRTSEHGTKATLLKDTPGFEERSKVYALGDLWVSDANVRT